MSELLTQAAKQIYDLRYFKDNIPRNHKYSRRTMQAVAIALNAKDRFVLNRLDDLAFFRDER